MKGMKARLIFRGEGYEYRVEDDRLIVTWEAIRMVNFNVGGKTYKFAVGYNLPEFPVVPPSMYPIEVEINGKVYRVCFVEPLPVFEEEGKLKTGIIFHLC